MASGGCSGKVHVYIARFPFPVEGAEIFPPERAAEIGSCGSPEVGNAKYYAWKLLEGALLHSFGLKMESLAFTRTERGKWECPSCHFSLSHSGNFAAVAVSEKPVGVDIEKRDGARFTVALARKITTEREEKELNLLRESARGAALNALWTKKEAAFKCRGEGSFQPARIETSEFGSITKEVQYEGERYLLTVVSEDAPHANFLPAEGIAIVDFKL